ncbi:disease resistance protein RPM1-like [Cornus florida]|uniref:disease resistance protein RPM1-like n=1 Tax=Cornus florida TaxID=4283 RepID=UPI0028988012|nr:disease resistance protein RPM1-like [Cornus florida]
MAEGFVEKVEKTTPEEVAESYFMALINRSMLQVVMRNPAGRPKALKMHDLMQGLALLVLKKEKFCTVLYDGSTDHQGSDQENGAHHLSILSSDHRELLKSWKSKSRLRTLFVFATNVFSPSLNTLPSGLKLLRVLDLEDAPIVKLPDELVQLFNLRYLNLRGTRVKELPKSIGRLHNLQTLDITDSKIEVLPTGITNLRHLIMYRCNRGHYSDFDYTYGTPSPSNICKLKNLQVLACVEANAGLMKQTKNITQLTRIGITKVREADNKDLCISIQNMKLLRYLFVMVTDEEEYLRMEALSSAPPCLNMLILVGKLEKVPRWFHSL